ncbi:hypothetical protein ACFL4Z_03605 [candidate division KSB1 bacterium]
MADLLNQSEIDDLLASAGEDSETPAESGTDTSESIRISGRTKTFAIRKIESIRFLFPYHSPIVKQENYIFDPNPETKHDEDKTVVRSLKNYVEYINHKKTG